MMIRLRRWRMAHCVEFPWCFGRGVVLSPRIPRRSPPSRIVTGGAFHRLDRPASRLNPQRDAGASRDVRKPRLHRRNAVGVGGAPVSRAP